MAPTAARRSLSDAATDFEDYVYGQITPGPWAPVTDYSLDGRRRIEGDHPRLIAATFAPTKVLDFGCGPGCLVALLREMGLDARGFEPNYSENIQRADPGVREFIDPLFPAGPEFDLVICREVLEHVPLRGSQFVDTIRRVVRASSRFIYVTTRYAQRPVDLLSVDLADNLDPTHITLLTKELVRTLFVLHGCKSRPDLEDILDWQGKGRCLVFEKTA